MMWVTTLPDKNAVGLPWVRATASAPSRSISSWSIRSSWKNRPTPTALVSPPGEEKLLVGISRVPKFSRPNVSSIRVSMQCRRHSSGRRSSQQ